MNINSGTFSRNGAGSVTYIMPGSFTPELMHFWIAGKSGDTETHIAVGYWHGGTDGTLQASAGKSSETRTKAMSHYAGTVEKVAFTVTSVDVGEFTLNDTASDVNYTIHWMAQAS